MLAAGALAKRQELASISNRATQEDGLELLIEKVESSWAHTAFTLVKGAQGLQLTEMDVILEVVEETTLTINTVASSRYVGYFGTVVSAWQQELRVIHQVTRSRTDTKSRLAI